MADMQTCVTEIASIQPAIIVHYGNYNKKIKNRKLKSTYSIPLD
jgi:hypothetical protein